MTLAKLQNAFVHYLLDGDQEIASLIRNTGGKQKRLSIYGEGYELRLREALADNFPRLYELLGDDDFARLCRGYLQANPSHFFSIRYVGHAMDNYLEHSPPFNKQPALAEMARFEWTLRDVFDAENEVLLTEASLRALRPEQWPDLALQFQPTLRHLALHSNVVTVWNALESNIEPPPPRWQNEPTHWLVWRRDLRTLFRSLQDSELLCWQAINQGLNFSQMCDYLSTHFPESAPQLAAAFVQTGLQEGWFLALTVCQ